MSTSVFEPTFDNDPWPKSAARKTVTQIALDMHPGDPFMQASCAIGCVRDELRRVMAGSATLGALRDAVQDAEAIISAANLAGMNLRDQVAQHGR